MTPKMWDVAVVGAGASGLIAAWRSASSGARVLLLERHTRPGRKLFATGNGRCNLSHAGFSLANFHGGQPHFPKDALVYLPEKETLALFETLGVSVIMDNRHRYYPRSLQAGSVVDILRFSCTEAGVHSLMDTEVTQAKHSGNHFTLHTKAHVHGAQNLIIACGGAANPGLGGSESGYKILETFGHQRTAILPGIVQLKTETDTIRSLRGQKWEAHCRLIIQGEKKAEEAGEVLFTEYGLSGPAVIQLSSKALRAKAAGQKPLIQLDLLPDFSEDSLAQHLYQRAQNHPARSREQTGIGLIPRVIFAAALRAAQIKDVEKPGCTLGQEKWAKIARQLKKWNLPIIGSQGLKNAQVTLGGIDTTDFNPQTLESWIQPGLYACGEVLDIDGDCGGYNLQWAWSSGYTAGTQAAIAARLQEPLAY